MNKFSNKYCHIVNKYQITIVIINGKITKIAKPINPA